MIMNYSFSMKRLGQLRRTYFYEVNEDGGLSMYIEKPIDKPIEKKRLVSLFSFLSEGESD